MRNTFNVEWICSVCDQKNKSNHTPGEVDIESYRINHCSECGNPVVVGITVGVKAVLYDLNARNAETVKLTPVSNTIAFPEREIK